MKKQTLPRFVNVFEGYVVKISLRSDTDHVTSPAWFSQIQLINIFCTKAEFPLAARHIVICEQKCESD